MSGASPVRVLVVMGVSGAGKSTVGMLLARRLGWEFVEADDFHSAHNIALMKAGHPLTDADRAPWLQAIAAHLDELRRARKCAVLACSALKKSYRDVLRGGHRDVRFIYLKVERDVLVRRLKERHGHFMPLTLLDSQLATLEEPTAAEDAIILPATGHPDTTLSAVLQALSFLENSASPPR